tara:strand:- start:785 stop:1123 length:339 start_codon:yes stop_codon:yes gene_type:complete
MDTQSVEDSSSTDSAHAEAALEPLTHEDSTLTESVFAPPAHGSDYTDLESETPIVENNTPTSPVTETTCTEGSLDGSVLGTNDDTEDSSDEDSVIGASEDAVGTMSISDEIY